MTNAKVEAIEERLLADDFMRLSRRVVKRPVVLYFGRPTFSDNTKYVFLRDVARERGYEVLWCAADAQLVAQLNAAGLPVWPLTEDIDATIDLLMHAAVAVFCCNPIEFLQGSAALLGCLEGAAKIQLWHGVSLKRLQLQLIPHLGIRHPTLRQPFEMASRLDWLLSPSEYLDDFFAEVFGTNQILRSGFPRNEVLLRSATSAEMIGSELASETQEAIHQARGDGRPVVLVAPTWQRNRTLFTTSREFFDETATFAQRTGALVLLKLHPSNHLNGVAPPHVSGVEVLDTGVDIYPHLKDVDALVTDYSSLAFDFLWLDKPVLTLDIPPGAHHNFEPDYSLVPDIAFRQVFTRSTYQSVLAEALDNDQLSAQRLAMRDALYDTDPSRACETVLALVDHLVERALTPERTVFHGA